MLVILFAVPWLLLHGAFAKSKQRRRTVYRMELMKKPLFNSNDVELYDVSNQFGEDAHAAEVFANLHKVRFSPNNFLSLLVSTRILRYG
ncbi:unnamed protein product [Anisakis simplex]|uniref:Orphan protein n=1 Tax=Anisakis simplex TaxID=6269 RepID=A0A0M3KDY9_ANISI|nr:unnamed protein product [Anisakis simplex]